MMNFINSVGKSTLFSRVEDRAETLRKKLFFSGGSGDSKIFVSAIFFLRHSHKCACLLTGSSTRIIMNEYVVIAFRD